RAVDGEVFLAHVKTAGYLGAAALRHELSRRRGLRWGPVRNGVAELANIPRGLVEAFSTRTGEINEEFAALIADGFTASGATKAAAQRGSRAPKKILADGQVRAAQHARLTDAGWTPGQVRTLGARIDRTIDPPTPADIANLADRLTGPAGLTAHTPTFTAREIVQQVAAWAGDRLDPDAIADIAERTLADPRIVLVDTAAARRRRQPEPVYTTLDLLEAEDSVLALARQGRIDHGGPAHRLLTPERVDRLLAAATAAPDPGGAHGTPAPPSDGATAVDAPRDPGTTAAGAPSGPGPAAPPPATPDSHATGDGAEPSGPSARRLSAEQVELARRILTSTDLVRPIIGPAGSGKTEAMRLVTTILTDAGYHVLAAAHGGRQTEQLADRLNIPARVVAGWLTLLDHTDDPATIWPAGTVLILDEATHVDTRHAERLLRHATRTHTVIIALGDPAQLGAVGAGGWFAHLVATTPDTPELTVLHRQAGPAMAPVRAALTGLRTPTPGAARRALHHLAADGRIRLCDSRDELLAAVVDDWYTAWHHR
ncbi:AAA family ATPase, partial [Frankia sp. CiP1_Cm_nod2]|uniref:AAA family ATPase n=1 Tax=Frankia sp. CiP1_Cm_nod2 TaxID=2897161 RepID=UPI002024FA7A